MFGFAPTADAGSVTKQLADYLRRCIESGEMACGTRLPPTRKAAEELHIARNLVIEVYEQLTAEGYLTSRTGSGTYVADGIEIRPARELPTSSTTETAPVPDRKERRFIDFDTGTPDLKHFPRRLWSKYVRETMNSEPDHIFTYSDIQGMRPLREAISRYVYRVKGISCSADQIMVTSGSSEGFLLLASAFANLFRHVYIEEPTIGFVADIFQKWNYAVHPIDVDKQGMMISRIPPEAAAGLMILTPSHQYPTGSILSIQRRQQAVQLAEAAGHYLLEDDYNSEFRHKGAPVPPLQVMAPSRVIYAATFSKTLSPALRIGFLIVPSGLMERVMSTKSELHLTTSGITQLALARFMEDGHYERHIHKMRAVYKRKRMFLAEQCRRLFGDAAAILGDEAGMHVQLAFDPGRYGPIDWNELETFGVRLGSFDDYARVKGRHNGKIVLGYGNLTEEEIAEGLLRLHRFMETKEAGR